MKSVRGASIFAAAAAALVVVGAAPAAPLLPSQKTALKKVQQARAAGRIDAATAAAARTEINRAAHLARALPRGRGYHVGVALGEVASFPGALTAPRALSLFGQLKANDDYFAKHWAPADRTDITGSDGIVYRYFGGAAFRFHPLANFGVLNADARARRRGGHAGRSRTHCSRAASTSGAAASAGSTTSASGAAGRRGSRAWPRRWLHRRSRAPPASSPTSRRRT